ncbi:ER membrane protein complex subunit 9-like isoform X3 [Narcine bancroftii]|uniref:ER membrane protein complex subunit 9-like isoform X3 n=1 Tax=Narcine bancroftii TaxID=1343680 RepID=UPI0038323396
MLGGHFGGAEVSRPSRAGLVHQRRPAESDSSPNPSSREMAEVEISARAYVKMHLHAAKHPSRAVNGLLVAEKAAEGGGDCLLLTDCVPLFHNGLALSVMLEVALNQVDLWSATNNQVIAGYYQANSQLLDRSPNLIAVKIGDRVAEHLKGAVLIMLDDTKLSGGYSGPALVVYERQDNKWAAMDKNLCWWRSCPRWDSTPLPVTGFRTS